MNLQYKEIETYFGFWKGFVDINENFINGVHVLICVSSVQYLYYRNGVAVVSKTYSKDGKLRIYSTINSYGRQWFNYDDRYPRVTSKTNGIYNTLYKNGTADYINNNGIEKTLSKI